MTDKVANERNGGGRAVLSCEEALARVYEYLDGELPPEEQEHVHEHLKICRECYPFFNFERLFLDFVRDRVFREEHDPALERRVLSLLEGDE